MRDYEFVTELDNDVLRRECWRELGRVDLYFLAAFILGYTLETQTDIHYKLCDLLETDKLRQLVLMFRGSFKTSMAVAKTIQWLIQQPTAQIGIGSDKIERAVERVKDVRRVLESCPLLPELYPELFYTDPARQSDLWTGDSINVIRTGSMVGFTKPSVSAFGLFPLPTGSHYSHVILDDVESEESINTPELIQQLNTRVSSLIPTLLPQAPLIMFGTIYCGEGPHTVLQKNWPTYRVPIVDKQGLPTFPTRFPMNVVDRIRADINDAWVFDGQYMLKSSPRTDKYAFSFSDTVLQQFTEMLQ